MTETERQGFEALGRLAVMASDKRLANRIDDNMTREQFHSYMNGVDSARVMVTSFIVALDELVRPVSLFPLSPAMLPSIARALKENNNYMRERGSK